MVIAAPRHCERSEATAHTTARRGAPPTPSSFAVTAAALNSQFCILNFLTHPYPLSRGEGIGELRRVGMRQLSYNSQFSILNSQFLNSPSRDHQKFIFYPSFFGHSKKPATFAAITIGYV
jgi:hypothetical protein